MNKACTPLLCTIYGSLTRALFIHLDAYTEQVTIATLETTMKQYSDRIALALNHPYINHGPSAFEAGILRFQLSIILEAMHQKSRFSPSDKASVLAEYLVTHIQQVATTIQVTDDGRIQRTTPP